MFAGTMTNSRLQVAKLQRTVVASIIHRSDTDITRLLLTIKNHQNLQCHHFSGKNEQDCSLHCRFCMTDDGRLLSYSATVAIIIHI